MPGVQRFIEERAKSQHAASDAEPRGVNAWIDRMGMNGSSIVPKINSKSEAGRRPSSRQAVADRSRVSMPVFNPQNIGNSRHASQQSRAPFESTLASRNTSIDGQSPQRRLHSESKALGVFDTDTEKLDDTTEFDNSVDFTVRSEAVTDDAAHSRGNSFLPHTRQAALNLQRHVSSQDPASLVSGDFVETNGGHDGDDEFDDASRFEDFDPSGRHDLANFSYEAAAFPFNGKGNGNEVAMHQESHPRFREQRPQSPNILPSFVKTDFDGGSQHHPHHVSSTAPRSISDDDETQSQRENEGSLRSATPDKKLMTRHVKAEVLADPQTDKALLQSGGSYNGVQVKKRKHSPGLETQKPLHDIQSYDAPPLYPTKHDGYSSPHHSTREQSAPQPNTQQNLDYEPQVLANMSYQQLADETFDTSPHPINLDDPALTNASSLSDKLHYLHSLDGPQESVQSQRQAFFSSLPISQYEECGDLMADQFSHIITKFKEARQQKRRLAMEFEDEVAEREKVVERRKVAVMDDLSRLRRAGQDVVRR